MNGERVFLYIKDHYIRLELEFRNLLAGFLDRHDVGNDYMIWYVLFNDGSWAALHIWSDRFD